MSWFRAEKVQDLELMGSLLPMESEVKSKLPGDSPGSSAGDVGSSGGSSSADMGL